MDFRHADTPFVTEPIGLFKLFHLGGESRTPTRSNTIGITKATVASTVALGRVVPYQLQGGNMSRRGVSVVVMTLSLAFAPLVFGQTDPGVRVGPPGAGQPLASVAANNPAPILDFFNAGKDDFEETETVPEGLGPRFNSRSCGACHAQPGDRRHRARAESPDRRCKKLGCAERDSFVHHGDRSGA